MGRARVIKLNGWGGEYFALEVEGIILKIPQHQYGWGLMNDPEKWLSEIADRINMKCQINGNE